MWVMFCLEASCGNKKPLRQTGCQHTVHLVKVQFLFVLDSLTMMGASASSRKGMPLVRTVLAIFPAYCTPPERMFCCFSRKTPNPSGFQMRHAGIYPRTISLTLIRLCSCKTSCSQMMLLFAGETCFGIKNVLTHI